MFLAAAYYNASLRRSLKALGYAVPMLSSEAYVHPKQLYAEYGAQNCSMMMNTCSVQLVSHMDSVGWSPRSRL